MIRQKKICLQIEKLMRLASPSSGASEPERVSAALEASRLFETHDFAVTERIPRRRITKPAPAGWTRSIAAFDVECALEGCRKSISRGDDVWRRVQGLKVEYRHMSAPCAEKG